ncbi:MAG TPA: hypothetical protein ENH94_09610, partial [Phycisphaerales bacterium]|nr:hypothetical protein [Phycisphaerales bacterium]
MANVPPIRQLKGRMIGRILIKMRILTRDKVHECLAIQKQRGGDVRLGQIFVEQGLVKELDLNVALAAQRGMEFVDLSEIDIPEDVIQYVPAQMAKTYRVVPLEYDSGANELTVVLDSPDNFRATDDLSTLMGFAVTAKVCDGDLLEEALKKYYPEEEGGSTKIVRAIQNDGQLIGAAVIFKRNNTISLS